MCTVLTSQDNEVILGKQPIMAEYGREVRVMLSKLPPEITKELISEYKVSTPEFSEKMEQAIMAREFVNENVAHENNLDKKWLSAHGSGRKFSEQALSVADEWNSPIT